MVKRSISRLIFVSVLLLTLLMTTAVPAFSDPESDEQNSNDADSSANEQIVIGGGERGSDYTYEDGVITILKSGTYSLSMADGISECTDRVVIRRSSEVSDVTFELNSMNMSTDSNCFQLDNYETAEHYVNLKFVLNGANTMTAPKEAIKSIVLGSDDCIFEGSGSLLLKNTSSSGGENAWQVHSITVNSGDVTLENGNINSLTHVTVNGGSLTVNTKQSNVDSITVVEGMEITGGKVNLNGGRFGIFIQTLNSRTDGYLKISGGETVMKGTTAGIYAGHQRPVTIDLSGDSVVEFDGNTAGLYFNRDTVMNVGGKRLTINAGTAGIYAGRSAAGTKLTFSNGVTEIISNGYGILLTGATAKSAEFDPAYDHATYLGPNKEGRERKTDEDVTNTAGQSTPYVLLIPKYPITYELGDGSLPEGTTNPDSYTEIDTIELNNPEPKYPAYVFKGWTGTDLSEPSVSVVIPEGSTGEREYTANYETTLTHVDKVDPTCTEDGNKEYWKNEDGSKFYTDDTGVTEISAEETVVPATGHDWGEWTTTKEATATEKGTKERVCKNDPSHIETQDIPAKGEEEVKYTFTKGTGSVYTKTEREPLKFTVKRNIEDNTTFSHYKSITVDGKEIDADSFEVASGSLEITLKSAYLEKLSNGKHTIGAVFDDGQAETHFNVKAKAPAKPASKSDPKKSDSAKTGDSSQPVMWALIICIAAAIMCGTAYIRFRKR